MFEYPPADSDIFEELVSALRRTEESSFVEREIDIRLERTFEFYIFYKTKMRLAAKCRFVEHLANPEFEF